MDVDTLARFDRDLTRLCGADGRVGVAVSGGPDSLALLMLAAAARPRQVEAATVDHGLRPESAAEARFVADLCARLGVAHETLAITVPAGASLQAQARGARYAAMTEWAGERRLDAILTAHHADDQAETLLMRLARGSGLAGLAGVRERNCQGRVPVLRPLLSWRKRELVQIVEAAGLTPLDDPSNRDPRHDRTRARALLAAGWPDPARLAASAAHLAEAEEALAYAAEHWFAERSARDAGTVTIETAGLPRELRRRLLLLAMAALDAPVPRGPDLDRALRCLAEGGGCTLSGLKLSGEGERWTLGPEPPRR